MQMRMQGPPPGMVPQAHPGAQVPLDKRLTLFVGKIKRGVGDDLMRALLKCCGNLLNWRRVTDPLTNSLKAFGYAQYGTPAEVLTTMRILNGLDIQGQALLLNVDDSTRKILDDHEKNSPVKPEEQIEADSPLIAQVRSMVDNYSSQHSGVDLSNLDPVMQQVPSVAGDEHKVGIVKSEIEKFREREKQHEDDEARRQREKLKRMKQEPPRDRNQERLDELKRQVGRLRQLREREREREYRQEERERREMRNLERKLDDWAYDITRGKEKEERREKESIKDRQRAIEREYADEEVWQRHCQDSRRRRFRARELEEDQEDRIKERKQRLAAQESGATEDMTDQGRGPPKVGFGLKASLSKVTTKRTSSVAAASDFEDDDNKTTTLEPLQKKRKLVKLDYAEVGLQTEEEKRRREERAQKIVARIPVEKDELFAYNIDWGLVEKNKVLDEQVRPWVTSKVVELLGNAEQDVIDFVLQKVRERTAPEQLLSELEPLLDKETELFTKMLWRLIIFHILSASTP